MISPIRRAIWCIILPLLTTSVWAQEQAQDTLKIELSDVAIESTRTFETTMNAARSVYVKVRDDKAHEPGISLKYSLRGIPGIRISDRGHFAFGERLLVRGMGNRDALGVRGAQVVLDGIPLTLADGQSILDIVDPAFISRAEVLRSPSSGIWGNASGGVLHLSTWDADSSALRLRYVGGSYGLSQTLASAQRNRERESLQIYGSRLSRTGYRMHSSGNIFRAGAQAQRLIGNSSKLGLVVNAGWQDVLAPGSLTYEELRSNPRQPDSVYAAQKSGKESMQIQGGLTLKTQTRLGTLLAVGYGTSYKLESPIRYWWSTVDRLAGGLNMQLSSRTERLAWNTGVEARMQRDDILDYSNEDGRKSSDAFRDQLEEVRNLATFAAAQYKLNASWGITGGLRLDLIRFVLSDHDAESTEFDLSDTRSFTALSTSIGAYYQRNALTAFANISTSFETPTTAELIEEPDFEYGFGDPVIIPGGFNEELDPKRTLGLEIGLRGHIPDWRLQIDAALFHLHIVDHVVNTFNDYINYGRNRHWGLEVALQWSGDAPVQMQLTYNLSKFTYLHDPARGINVPGTPIHDMHVAVRTESFGWNFELTTEFASDLWANLWADSGVMEYNSGHVVFDLYISRKSWSLGSAVIQPFLRVQNLLNAKYVGSLIVIDYYYGRHYEPAAERSFQLGLGLTL